MQTNPEQWAVDFAHELWPMAQVGPSEGIEDAALRIAEAIQAAFAERESRLVGALEDANTLLTKAVGDIVAYRIMANKRPDPSVTAEYIEAINAIDTTLAALKDRTHG